MSSIVSPRFESVVRFDFTRLHQRRKATSILMRYLMSLRFHQIFKILPGIKLNLSKSGFSLSFGTRGLSLNLGKRGTMGTIGIPGTGLSYRKKLKNFFSLTPPDENSYPTNGNHDQETNEAARLSNLNRRASRAGLPYGTMPPNDLEEGFHKFEPWGIFILWTIALFIILFFPFGMGAIIAPIPAWVFSKITMRKLRNG